MENGGVLAAGLLALTGMLVHVFIGGKLFVRPFLKNDIPDEQKWLAYFVWHVGTLAPGFLAAGFLAAAWLPARSDYAAIAVAFAALLVVTASWVSFKGKRPLLSIPAIPIFGSVSVIGLIGLLS